MNEHSQFYKAESLPEETPSQVFGSTILFAFIFGISWFCIWFLLGGK